MQGDNSFRKLQKDGLEAGGFSGDNSDEGCEGCVPHNHGATSSLDLVQGEVLVMGVL